MKKQDANKLLWCKRSCFSYFVHPWSDLCCWNLFDNCWSFHPLFHHSVGSYGIQTHRIQVFTTFKRERIIVHICGHLSNLKKTNLGNLRQQIIQTSACSNLGSRGLNADIWISHSNIETSNIGPLTLACSNIGRPNCQYGRCLNANDWTSSMYETFKHWHLQTSAAADLWKGVAGKYVQLYAPHLNKC